MTLHTSVKIPGSSIHLRGIFKKKKKTPICAPTRPTACKAGLPFSIQHTEVHTIVPHHPCTLFRLPYQNHRSALYSSFAPKYHCATPLASKNLAAENTILLKTISIVILKNNLQFSSVTWSSSASNSSLRFRRQCCAPFSERVTYHCQQVRHAFLVQRFGECVTHVRVARLLRQAKVSLLYSLLYPQVTSLHVPEATQSSS